MRFLPSRLSRRFARALTVPNVLATLALLASLGGTAYAAITVTGTNVKDGSLTSPDVRNLSLGTTDFSSITRTAVRKRGDQGPPGDQGPMGTTGNKGSVGSTGVPAPRASTYQLQARNSRVGGAHINPKASDFDSFTCADADAQGDTLIGCAGSTGTPIRFPRWNYWCSYMDPANKHCITTNVSVDQLSRTFLTVLKTADNPNAGLLNMPYRGTIVMNATATFFTQRSPANQRLECQLQIARVENGLTQPAMNVGVPITQYRVVGRTDLNKQERLLNIGISGAIEQTAGVFETWLACRAPDDDNLQDNRLEFIEGNISVLTTRTNGQA